MSESGMMPVAIQRRCLPETQQVIRVAMHFNLSHLLDAGWEFPRVRLCETAFGAWVEGPLKLETAAA